jgi:glutamyl-tRNA synthetase
MPGIKERAKTLLEVAKGADFLRAARPLPLDEKAAKLLDGDTKSLLGRLLPRLEARNEWTAEGIEIDVRAFAEDEGVKLGKVAQPLRAAATGQAVSPPIFDVLATLGRDEALARIRDQVA